MTHVKFELPTDDMERAKKFYLFVFNWQFEQLPFNYALIDTHGKTVNPLKSNGGLSPRNEFVKSPTLIIDVDSIDETAEKIKSSGGTLLNAKEKVGDFGYSLYAKDTEGNIFCIWENIT